MKTDAGLDRYKLTDNDTRLLDGLGFRLLTSNVNLEAIDFNLPAIAAFKKQKAVYFWRMRYNGEEYKIYVGKTNSLPRRLKEYGNKFQPGVPNDFKLRHFQSWSRSRFPGSALDLYAALADQNQAVETEVWQKTTPFINERAGVPSHKLKNSHFEYYKSIFEEKLLRTKAPTSRKVAEQHSPNKSKSPSHAKQFVGSNHEMIKKAMEGHAGKLLGTAEIQRIILAKFPQFNPGSCLPNDHAAGNKGCCPCAATTSRIFDRHEIGQYLVR
jgi:hypothetical protein